MAPFREWVPDRRHNRASVRQNDILYLSRNQISRRQDDLVTIHPARDPGIDKPGEYLDPVHNLTSLA